MVGCNSSVPFVPPPGFPHLPFDALEIPFVLFAGTRPLCVPNPSPLCSPLDFWMFLQVFPKVVVEPPFVPCVGNSRAGFSDKNVDDIAVSPPFVKRSFPRPCPPFSFLRFVMERDSSGGPPPFFLAIFSGVSATTPVVAEVSPSVFSQSRSPSSFHESCPAGLKGIGYGSSPSIGAYVQPQPTLFTEPREPWLWLPLLPVSL